MIAAFVVDFSGRGALAGLAFGAISRYLPYGTIVCSDGRGPPGGGRRIHLPADSGAPRTQASPRRDVGLFGRRDGFKYL